jgi:hypothetical protein
MYRRDVLGIILSAAVVVAPGVALAQQKSLKDQLVGSWSLLLVDGKNADGTQAPLFGPNPDGLLIFTPEGRFSLQIMRTINRPPFASNNRDTGTAEENKAAVQGTLSAFGTYTADEANKSFTWRVEASSFPNWEGKALKFQVSAITDEVLTFSLPAASSTRPGAGYVSIENVWKKLK